MHIRSLRHIAATLVAGLSLHGIAAPTPAFARIASELDMGGDYLEVVNAATFQSDIESALDLLQGVAAEARVLKDDDLILIGKVRKMLASSGLLSFRGRGSSVIAAEDGSFWHRSFLLTEKGRNPTLNVFACADRKPSVENYLPNATALALSFSADIRGTALFAADVLDQLELEQGQLIRAFCTPQNGQPSVFEGIAPGTALALTLDANHPIKIPDRKLLVPMPGLVVAQAVKNDMPWIMLKASVAELVESSDFTCSGTPDPAFPDIERLVIHGDTMLRQGITPACAYDRKGGVIVIASSSDLLGAALSAGIRKQGRLLDGPDFAQVLPAGGELSGIVYVSPKVMPTLVDLLRQLVQEDNAPVSSSIKKLIDTPPAIWYVGAFVRKADGLKTVARSGFGACNTLRMLFGDGMLSSVGSLGVLSGALFPAISQAQTSSQTSAFAMRGRNLFVGLVSANLDREAAGLESAWPRTKVAADANADDIAGKIFGSGCEYFNALFDTAHFGDDGKWTPYVSLSPDVVASNLATDKRIRPHNVDWCIAANVTDDLDDNTPVLISANFNPELLPASWDGETAATRVLPIGPSSGAAKSLFGDKCVVIVRKGGATQVIKAKQLTYETLYEGRPFAAQKNPVVYLTPTGVAVPNGRVATGLE